LVFKTDQVLYCGRK